MGKKLDYYRNIVRKVREIILEDNNVIDEIEEEENAYFDSIAAPNDFDNKINKMEEETKEIILRQPNILSMYKYDGYTIDDLRSIYFYSFIFDRYINLKERGEDLSNPKYNDMIKDHKQLFKFRCEDIKKDTKNIIKWVSFSPLIRPFFNFRKMRKPPKINKTYISKELYNIYRSFEFQNVICPEYLLGDRFYEMNDNQFLDQMIQARDAIITQLQDLSYRLSKKSTSDYIYVYRGVALPKHNPYSITTLKGFTSCSYDYEVAKNFAINSAHYNPENKGKDLISVVLTILIPPDINIFTTDVITIQYEAEVIITDPVKIIYEEPFEGKRASKVYISRGQVNMFYVEEKDNKRCECTESFDVNVYEIPCRIERLIN